MTSFKSVRYFLIGIATAATLFASTGQASATIPKTAVAGDIFSEIGDAVKDILAWGAKRSIAAAFNNNTSLALKLTGTRHSSGNFGNYLPADRIDPNGHTVFNSRSTGFMLGTVGYIDYATPDGGLTARINWSNPFAGSNKCHVSLGGWLASLYESNCIAGGGNNGAQIRFTLSLRESSRFMDNIDLYGSDYANFPINEDNPSICQNACANDVQCLAWTYVKPHTWEENARCWLKNAIPDPSATQETISGIK